LCCAIAVFVAIVGSGPLWWATQLWGLPDIGDPFDVAAFRARTIPDDRNAFVLYDQAAAMLKPRPDYLAKATGKVNLLARWPDAHRDLRRWAEDNREALAVYRRAAERPDALDRAIGLDEDKIKTFRALWTIHLIVLLETSRLEKQGDMAGAWSWYRALLRTAHHAAMHSDAYRRSMILRWQRQVRIRLKEWAADRGTTPAMLRQAIRDVVACEALAPSETDTLKVGYLEAIDLLGSASNPGRDVPLGRFSRFWNPDFQLNPEQIQALWDWWRFGRHEPERSRRVIRLLTANRLAYFEMPAAKRPKADPKAAVEFYRFGSESPAAARALSPEDLDSWFDTAYDAQQLHHYLDASGSRVLESEEHAGLLVLLATELYRRDHGSDPPSNEALVGPYLERLPAGADAVSEQAIPKTGKPLD
jgi:hypothetical protein